MYVCAVVGDLSSPSDANYDPSSSNPTEEMLLRWIWERFSDASLTAVFMPQGGTLLERQFHKMAKPCNENMTGLAARETLYAVSAQRKHTAHSSCIQHKWSMTRLQLKRCTGSTMQELREKSEWFLLLFFSIFILLRLLQWAPDIRVKLKTPLRLSSASEHIIYIYIYVYKGEFWLAALLKSISITLYQELYQIVK